MVIASSGRVDVVSAVLLSDGHGPAMSWSVSGHVSSLLSFRRGSCLSAPPCDRLAQHVYQLQKIKLKKKGTRDRHFFTHSTRSPFFFFCMYQKQLPLPLVKKENRRVQAEPQGKKEKKQTKQLYGEEILFLLVAMRKRKATPTRNLLHPCFVPNPISA